MNTVAYEDCSYVDFINSLEGKKIVVNCNFLQKTDIWSPYFPFLDYVKELKVYFLELNVTPEDHKTAKVSL